MYTMNGVTGLEVGTFSFPFPCAARREVYYCTYEAHKTYMCAMTPLSPLQCLQLEQVRKGGFRDMNIIRLTPQ